MVSSWLNEAQQWVKGLLGDKLEAALSTVTAAQQSGTVGAQIHPEVQGFVQTLDQLRLATNAYLARAMPLVGDNPELEDRAHRLVFAYQTLATNWQDPANTRPNAAAAQRFEVGVAPVVWVALVTVGLGSASWAVSKMGAAWAIAAKGDAEVALAQVQLQQRDLEARVAASQDGRHLPPSTVAPPNPRPETPGEVDSLVPVAAGAVGLAVVVGGIAWLVGGRRR